MEHKLVGTVLPVLEMTLQPGESIIAEAGELSWISGSIELRTVAQTAGAKNLMGVFQRAVGGGSIFMTEYVAKGEPGLVAFATKVPGQILPIEVRPEKGYVVHRNGFICATPGIEVSMWIQRKLGAGLFGGKGFILQKLSGTADAWIELDGEVVIYDLAPGETLRVQPGHVAMFEDTVRFDITTIRDIKTVLFSEGLFLATVTGPGRVWLQSLPLSSLAGAIAEYLPMGGS